MVALTLLNGPGSPSRPLYDPVTRGLMSGILKVLRSHSSALARIHSDLLVSTPDWLLNIFNIIPPYPAPDMSGSNILNTRKGYMLAIK